MLLLLKPRAFNGSSDSTVFYYSTKGSRTSPTVKALFKQIKEERKKRKRIVRVIQRVDELYDRYEDLISKKELTAQENRFVIRIKKRIEKQVAQLKDEDEAIVLLLLDLNII